MAYGGSSCASQCNSTFILIVFYYLITGAKKLVEHLHNKGVPIAMATSSSQDSVAMKMQSHKELLNCFDHTTMGSSDPEVTKGKPDPMIFLVCASRFPDKPKPEDVSLRCLYDSYILTNYINVNTRPFGKRTLLLNVIERCQNNGHTKLALT